jgi:hypothetical protein
MQREKEIGGLKYQFLIKMKLIPTCFLEGKTTGSGFKSSEKQRGQASKVHIFQVNLVLFQGVLNDR